MKKVIFYCMVMFSSAIAFAILMHGSMVGNEMRNWLFEEEEYFILMFFIIFLLSLVLASIEVYKKDKNN